MDATVASDVVNSDLSVKFYHSFDMSQNERQHLNSKLLGIYPAVPVTIFLI